MSARDIADRLPTGAAFRRQLGLGADVAEVALVDREGVRQRHRERFDVGVPVAGPQVEAKRRVLAPPGRLAAAELLTVIFGLKASVAQLTAWK